MDPITHIVLSGSAAALCAPAGKRRAALLAGAALGTLPDLDIFPLSLPLFDDVTRVTWHRGPTHSLFTLIPFGVLLWLSLRRWCGPVRDCPRRWFAAILSALLIHPILDCFTSYGTQLFWPLPFRPVMLGNIAIADPVFTLPLAVGCVAAWFLRERPAARKWLAGGCIASAAYLCWTLAAQAYVEHAAKRELAKLGLAGEPTFVTPAFFGSVRWRVVVMQPQGFMEGSFSFANPAGGIWFRSHGDDRDALAAVADYPKVRRLAWFTHGFLSADADGTRLVVTDLRMGNFPNYYFRYFVAEKDASGAWQPVRTTR